MLQQGILSSCQQHTILKLKRKRLKHCTWGQSLNQGKYSRGIDLSVKKWDSLKIEDRDLSHEIDMMIPREDIIKIRYQDMIKIDQQEGRITKHSVIDCSHGTSQDQDPLLDALAVDVIDAMKM